MRDFFTDYQMAVDSIGVIGEIQGLDLHFDEMRANAATIRRIVEMLERAQVDAYTAGIKITEFTSAGENTAWLFRGGALVGVWNFDKGEILHWNPRMIFGWVGK